MLLRRGRQEDALSVAEVHVRSWQAAYAGLLPADFLDGLDPARRASHYTFSGGRDDDPSTMVVEEDGRVRGFATIGAARDPDARAAGEVFAIYVDPDFWRHGCGRMLMSDARTRLADRGFAEAVLWVLHGNSRAEAFYRADGWARDGLERDEDLGTGWLAAGTARSDAVVIHEARWRRLL